MSVPAVDGHDLEDLTFAGSTYSVKAVIQFTESYVPIYSKQFSNSRPSPRAGYLICVASAFKREPLLQLRFGELLHQANAGQAGHRAVIVHLINRIFDDEQTESTF